MYRFLQWKFFTRWAFLQTVNVLAALIVMYHLQVTRRGGEEGIVWSLGRGQQYSLTWLTILSHLEISAKIQVTLNLSILTHLLFINIYLFVTFILWHLSISTLSLSLCYRGYQQQDAHEFMRYLLDRLHSELSQALTIVANDSLAARKSGLDWKSSVVSQMFGGTLQSDVSVQYLNSTVLVVLSVWNKDELLVSCHSICVMVG